MSNYILEEAVQGYDGGEELRDVTLAQARAMECNRCGDCCNGLSEHIKLDGPTGLPLFTWGTKYPEDFYRSRYGQDLLVPVVRGDGQLVVGADFERDTDDKPYTCFTCSMLEHQPEGSDGPESGCRLRRVFPNPDPQDPAQNRPLNCGSFPVFGLEVDDSLVAGHTFVPPTGSLPRCTWYGIRVVGPWKDTPYWRNRWEKQQHGEEVPDLSIKPETIQALALRTKDRHSSRRIEE